MNFASDARKKQPPPRRAAGTARTAVAARHGCCIVCLSAVRRLSVCVGYGYGYGLLLCALHLAQLTGEAGSSRQSQTDHSLRRSQASHSFSSYYFSDRSRDTLEASGL